MAFGTTTKIEKYNPERIELIKKNLQQHIDANQPRYYEIQVDALKAVPKTTDLNNFDNHELYLTEDAQSMKIMLFQGNSHKYDAFEFYFKEDVKPTVSLGEVSSDDKVRNALRERDIIEYKKRISELEEELSDSLDYVDQLEKQVEFMRQSAGKNDKFWELIMLVAQNGGSFLRRHPHVTARIPIIGEALAGDFALQTMEEKLLAAQLAQKQTENPINPNANTQSTFTEK